jgi:hypothetical protein
MDCHEHPSFFLLCVERRYEAPGAAIQEIIATNTKYILAMQSILDRAYQQWNNRPDPALPSCPFDLLAGGVQT